MIDSRSHDHTARPYNYADTTDEGIIVDEILCFIEYLLLFFYSSIIR